MSDLNRSLAFDAPHIQQGWTVGRFFKLPVHCYQRILCDGTDRQGYMDPVVFVWTDGDHNNDTNRRPWIRHGGCVYLHCAQAEDRVKRERAFAGKRKYITDRRSCKAGERDYQRYLSH